MEGAGLRIGIVSCSGSECLGGIIARLAAGKVISELRYGQTVGQCLPLFLTGNGREQQFAKNYPTITVDGCRQACARSVVEKYSGKVIVPVSVPDILGSETAELPVMKESLVVGACTDKVDTVINSVLTKVDTLLAMLARLTAKAGKNTCTCGCGGSSSDVAGCDCSSGCDCGGHTDDHDR